MMKTLLTTVLMVLASSTALAEKENKDYPLGERSVFSDRAVEQRIQPVGSVCVEGEDCATQMASADNGGGGGDKRSASDINDQYCSTCHKSGAAGAPVVGEKSEWESRIDKGMDKLVKHAWEGFKGMPAKGTCSDCSEEEIKKTVEYMVDESK